MCVNKMVLLLNVSTSSKNSDITFCKLQPALKLKAGVPPNSEHLKE